MLQRLPRRGENVRGVEILNYECHIPIATVRLNRTWRFATKRVNPFGCRVQREGRWATLWYRKNSPITFFLRREISRRWGSNPSLSTTQRWVRNLYNTPALIRLGEISSVWILFLSYNLSVTFAIGPAHTSAECISHERNTSKCAEKKDPSEYPPPMGQ